MLKRVVNVVSRTPLEALAATGCRVIGDASLLDKVPPPSADKVEVTFFQPEASEFSGPGWITDKDLEKCFVRRGLGAADPVTLAAVNEADQSFLCNHPHGTHWRDGDGTWYKVEFDSRRNGIRTVCLSSYGDAWVGRQWWFAGV